jgi:site-specific recombinase XerD
VETLDYHPLESVIAQYLSEKDITTGTKELYKVLFKQYVQYLKENHISYASKTDFVQFLDWKRREGCSDRWIYQLTSAIKGLYKYLRLHYKRLGLPHMYANDIAETIKNVRIVPNLSKPILTIDEVKQLIQCLKTKRHAIWEYRDYAMMYLMITTGLRGIEISRAKRTDISILGNQSILYIQGKGRRSKDEFVKLTPSVLEAIQAYVKKRKDKNPYLFISHSQRSKTLYLKRTFFVVMMKRVLKKCGLEHTKITAHSLRHTAATLNLLRGSTLEQTSRFMRHEQMSTTLIYAHHLERLEDDSEQRIEAFILKEDSLFHGKRWIILDF